MHYPSARLCPADELSPAANQFIGVGAEDPTDNSNIVPVAVIEAVPETTSFFVPTPKYYISWGTYTAGEIVDVTTIAVPALVDFTGKAATKAMVEHTFDGSWVITYN